MLALSYERKVDVQMELVGQNACFASTWIACNFPNFKSVSTVSKRTLSPARQQIQARFAEFRAQLEVQYDAILLPESRS